MAQSVTEGVIDLRSDTVTRPTAGMRDAMARAEVGDDVLGDDPTVLALQQRVAALLGKPAALFVPSGTMANQLAIRAQTEPGDDVLTHRESHIIHYETGGPAALSGVMINPLDGPAGRFEEEDVAAAVHPENVHSPRSRMLVVENTHNRGGGSVWGLDHVQRVTDAARARGLRTHMDGARLWNACAATGVAPAAYAAYFDTVSVCFSKGLGAPVGSALVGDAATLARAYRFRKMFGGGMRQSGYLAAAAMYAIENHQDRLTEDHAAAARLGEQLSRLPGIAVPLRPETNMVFFQLEPGRPAAGDFCAAMKRHGVWMLPMGPRRVRAVWHLDVPAGAIERVVAAVRAALAGPPAA